MGIVEFIVKECALIRVIDLQNLVKTVSHNVSISFFFLTRLITHIFRYILSNYKYIPIKYVIRMLIWVAIWSIFIFIDFGSLWIIFTMFYLIVTNLGERKPGEWSAYSVFNKGFQRILGSIDIEQFENEIRNNNVRWEENGDEEEYDSEDLSDEGRAAGKKYKRESLEERMQMSMKIFQRRANLLQQHGRVVNKSETDA